MLTTDMLEPVKLDSFLVSKKEKILSIETTFFFFFFLLPVLMFSKKSKVTQNESQAHEGMVFSN